MPNKEFLENYPLLKKFKLQIPGTLYEINKAPINMTCPNCTSVQTFNMVNEYYEHTHPTFPSKSIISRMVYLCQSCKTYHRFFFIHISHKLDYVCKLGQYPEWEIQIDNDLEKNLNKHASTFRKGLVCESQGYGIGAFSYYRRITEMIIDELLDSIIDLIDEENREKYHAALLKTKATRVTQEKIDLVKDLLPSILRPNNMNPLGILHSELSEGLHAQSDEKCLEIAGHIREVLTFLATQIIQSKSSTTKFTNSMRTILDKKSQGQSSSTK